MQVSFVCLLFVALIYYYCREINISVASGAVPPITIVQLIPGGQSVVINSAETSYTLDADVNVGTTLMYFVNDSIGAQGGVSPFYTVSGSSDSSCLINPPTSTAGMSATATATARSRLRLRPSRLHRHLVQTEMLLLSQARQAAAGRCLLHWSSSVCACGVNGIQIQSTSLYHHLTRHNVCARVPTQTLLHTGYPKFDHVDCIVSIHIIKLPNAIPC
ncbi:hypothetical protein BDR07DRAFT_268133 [Suillus spraguei]|nr:hypothetical protein BDR07DRAFT_268133 [Suillus spraguei]